MGKFSLNIVLFNCALMHVGDLSLTVADGGGGTAEKHEQPGAKTITLAPEPEMRAHSRRSGKPCRNGAMKNGSTGCIVGRPQVRQKATGMPWNTVITRRRNWPTDRQ